MATTTAALTQQLAEAIQDRDDARRQLATLRAVLVARGDGEWDDDKVATEIERHVSSVVADHRRIVGEQREKLGAALAKNVELAGKNQVLRTGVVVCTCGNPGRHCTCGPECNAASKPVHHNTDGLCGGTSERCGCSTCFEGRRARAAMKVEGGG